MSPTDSELLLDFLTRLRTDAHHLYAMMEGLPKNHFYLARYRGDNCVRLTLHQFLTRARTFTSDDDFSVCFAVHLDRIDSRRAQEYEDCICLDFMSKLTPQRIEELFWSFLESYCEKCMHDDAPFLLDEEVISHFGFTPVDVKKLQGRVKRYNTAARKQIHHEYETLRCLSLIREAYGLQP